MLSRLCLLTLAAFAALALGALPALAAPDLSGTVVINEPNGFQGVCDQPCFIAEKFFEVFLDGNPTGPGVCAAGENTYLYTITHLGGTGTPIGYIPDLLKFEIAVPALNVSSAGFIPGPDVSPSSTLINTLVGVVAWDFLAPPIPTGSSSDRLFICSTLLPGPSDVSVGSQSSLDAPGTCTGPVAVPCQLDVTKTCCFPPPPSFSGGNDCQGKVTRMVFSYTGDTCSGTTNDQEGKAKCTNGSAALAEPVSIVFTGKGSDKLSASPAAGIAVGGETTFTTTDSKFRSGTKFEIRQGGELRQKLEIHTSCSKDLNVGDQFGGMLLIELTTTEGGTVGLPSPDDNTTMCLPAGDPPGTQCDSRLTEAVFIYTGAACQVPLGNPQGGKAQCSGDATGAVDVDIIYTGNDPADITVSLPSGLNDGDTVRVTATGRDELHSSTPLLIQDAGGTLQTLDIHTSCSQPLALGDEFGSLKLVEFTTKDGGPFILPDPDPPTPTNECTAASAPPGPHCTTKVEALGLRYLGGDCNETTNDQGGKAKCDDFGASSEPVRIVAFEGSSVFLDTGSPANVGFGDVVTAVAGAGNRSELLSKTFVDIFNAAGMKIQELEIHTSCSKALNLGDRFGSLEVFSIDRKDDGLVSLGALVEFQYTITNPSPPNSGPVNSVTLTDSELGVLASGLSLDENESVTIFEKTVITVTTSNTATVTGNQPGGQCIDATAQATVTIEPPPPVPLSCADGKPQELIFEYLGTTCAATTNQQNEKFSCSGALNGEFPVIIVPTSSGFTVSPSTETVSLNDLVTFTATGSKLASGTEFEVRQGATVLQTLDVHTSCSAPLAEGDLFGSMLLRTYVPEN